MDAGIDIGDEQQSGGEEKPADDDLHAPQDNGRPQDQGWKISRIKITNGCYEVYGKDDKNNPVETFFHPKTFEVVTAPK